MADTSVDGRLRMKGIITTWNHKKGYGFVKGPVKETFLHATDVDLKYRADIDIGVYVEYEVKRQADKRQKAVNVTLVQKASGDKGQGVPGDDKHFDKTVRGCIGRIKRIPRDKPFIFISNATDTDFFCPIKNIRGDVPMKEGQKVYFDAVPTNQRLFMAIDVTSTPPGMDGPAPKQKQKQTGPTRRYRIPTPEPAEDTDAYVPQPTDAGTRTDRSDTPPKRQQQFRKIHDHNTGRQRTHDEAFSSTTTNTKQRKHLAQVGQVLLDMLQMQDEEP